MYCMYYTYFLDGLRRELKNLEFINAGKANEIETAYLAEKRVRQRRPPKKWSDNAAAKRRWVLCI